MNGNILIVDDNTGSLKLLKDILTAENFAVRLFNNGELALRSTIAEAPELVLLDIRMPCMDGFEVCRRLKENELLKDIPVIFISAASDLEDKVKAFQVGGVDYILKPFQKEEIIARVRTHVSLSRSRPAGNKTRRRSPPQERKKPENRAVHCAPRALGMGCKHWGIKLV